jgi:hypothetical protein
LSPGLKSHTVQNVENYERNIYARFKAVKKGSISIKILSLIILAINIALRLEISNKSHVKRMKRFLLQGTLGT